MSDYICLYPPCAYRTNTGRCGITGGYESCQYIKYLEKLEKEKTNIKPFAGKRTNADVVERKHGKWEDNAKGGGWKCSECGFISYSIGFYQRYNSKYRMRFCPNCGAMMEE